MINVQGPDIATMSNGSYKVIIWGQHPDHVMDWSGCNYRYIVVKGQPRHGFDEPDEALAWWRSVSEDSIRAEHERAIDWSTVGTHLSDDPGIGAQLLFQSAYGIKYPWR